MYLYRHRLGARGLLVLGLSLLAILLSGGLSLLWVAWRVWSIARHCPTVAPPGATLLVPGLRLEQCALADDFRRRLARVVVLWQGGWRGRVYLLGGETSPGCGSEAAGGRGWLLEQGVDEAAIRLEERSRNTLENLRYVQVMLGAQPVVIITSRYHLARSAALARALGMGFSLCAAESHLVPDARTLRRLLREAFSLHWYYSGVVVTGLLRRFARQR